MDKKTVKLTGDNARNFFAKSMVENYGAKGALERCSKGSPIEAAVKYEIELKSKSKESQNDN